MQLEIAFTDTQPGGDTLAEFCARLQPLPSLLRYYDEFDDTTRSIQSPSDTNSFEIYFHGRILRVDLSQRHPHCGLILRHMIAMMIEQGLAASTIASYFSKEHYLKDEDIRTLIRTGPLEIGLVWAKWRACEWPAGAYTLAKNVLHLLCNYRWNGWSNDYRS